MDFITFLKKNTGAMVLVGLLIPIGIALLYGGGKSIWVRRRNKKESTTIYDFLVSSNAYDKALTNDEITQATGIPRERIIEHCDLHPKIKDAGKRQRSWRLRREDEEDDE